MAVRIRLAEQRPLAFAVSPLAELVAALHVLDDPSHHPAAGWATTVHDRLPPALAAQVPGLSWLWRAVRPGFLLADRAGEGLLADELGRLRALDPQRFAAAAARPLLGRDTRAEVQQDSRLLAHARARGTAVVSAVELLLTDPAALRDRLCDFLDGCWAAFFAADWQRLHASVADEAARRGDLAETAGPRAALAQLPATTVVSETMITIDKVPNAVVDATASPLLLAPSVLGAPHVTVQLDAAWPPGVQYPLVTGGQPVALAVVRRRLAALADPQRLRLCRSLLREARSTQELAALHGLTPPTVSRHLRALRDAELVTTDRQGHFVRYRLDAAAVRSLGPDLLDALLR